MSIKIKTGIKFIKRIVGFLSKTNGIEKWTTPSINKKLAKVTTSYNAKINKISQKKFLLKYFLKNSAITLSYYNLCLSLYTFYTLLSNDLQNGLII